MELKWTNKALSDLVRLYEFLALVNKGAATRAMQALTKGPDDLHTTSVAHARDSLTRKFTNRIARLVRPAARIELLPLF